MTDHTPLTEFDQGSASESTSDSAAHGIEHDDHPPDSTHDDEPISADEFEWHSVGDGEESNSEEVTEEADETDANGESDAPTEQSSEPGSPKDITPQPYARVRLPEDISLTPPARLTVSEEALVSLLERTNQLLAAIVQDHTDVEVPVDADDLIPEPLESVSLKTSVGNSETGADIGSLDSSETIGAILRGLIVAFEEEASPDADTISSDGLFDTPAYLSPALVLIRIKELLDEAIGELTLRDGKDIDNSDERPASQEVPEDHATETATNPVQLTGVVELPSLEVRYLTAAIILLITVLADESGSTAHLVDLNRQVFESGGSDEIGVIATDS
jgi:hypothetical protein